MIHAKMNMFSSIMKSKFISDHYLKKYGLLKTTQRFDHLSGRGVIPADIIRSEIKQMIQSGAQLFVGCFGSIDLLETPKTN